MPLSEYEQRQLEQIESALYAEDPKFASHVRGSRFRAAASGRRIVAAVVFVIGVAALVGGMLLESPLNLIVPLTGFVFMFAAGLLLLWRGKSATLGVVEDDGTIMHAPEPSRSHGVRSRVHGNRTRVTPPAAGRNAKKPSLAARLERRFQGRFNR